MVTFEQILVKYIYQNKKVSLQGFGTVVLSAAIPDYDLIHKNKHLPIEGTSFEYDPRATTDDKFIEFFAQQRGKIKPLAISDIESHLQLARQLMNIGKPYEVEGLGMFSIGKTGEVIFTGGNFTVPLAETQSQHRLKERTEVQEKIESEASSSGMSTGAKRGLLVVAILLIVGIGGWFAWSKFFAPGANGTNGTEEMTDSLPLIDSNNTAPIDTSAQSALLPSTSIVTDSLSPVRWKAYFRNFSDKQSALEKWNLYKGNRNPVMLETSDSVNFRLYVIMESAVADTARKADSLRRFYSRPVTLERVNP